MPGPVPDIRDPAERETCMAPVVLSLELTSYIRPVLSFKAVTG